MSIMNVIRRVIGKRIERKTNGCFKESNLPELKRRFNELLESDIENPEVETWKPMDGSNGASMS